MRSPEALRTETVLALKIVIPSHFGYGIDGQFRAGMTKLRLQ